MNKNLTEIVFILDCSGSMAGLEAITAFMEGSDFEDVIRTAVSLGGDCDTLTCIAGSIAEAFYGVPMSLELACRDRLPEDMVDVLSRFRARISSIARCNSKRRRSPQG